MKKKAKVKELVKCPICNKECKGQKALDMHISRTKDDAHNSATNTLKLEEVMPLDTPLDEIESPSQKLDVVEAVQEPEVGKIETEQLEVESIKDIEPQIEEIQPEVIEEIQPEVEEAQEIEPQIEENITMIIDTDFTPAIVQDGPVNPIYDDSLVEMPETLIINTDESVVVESQVKLEVKPEKTKKPIKTYMGAGLIAPTSINKLRTLTSHRA